MQHDPAAYLLDIIEACEAITTAIGGMDVDAYAANRLVRSSVEREFITIGEAVAALRTHSPEIFAQISQGQRIVDFRNQLTHGYMTVNDAIVWGIAKRDVPLVESECRKLLSEIERQTK